VLKKKGRGREKKEKSSHRPANYVASIYVSQKKKGGQVVSGLGGKRGRRRGRKKTKAMANPFRNTKRGRAFQLCERKEVW